LSVSLCVDLKFYTNTFVLLAAVPTWKHKFKFIAEFYMPISFSKLLDFSAPLLLNVYLVFREGALSCSS